jgi:histidine triad (HIT) family protein
LRPEAKHSRWSAIRKPVHFGLYLEDIVPAARISAEKRGEKPCKFCGIAGGTETGFALYEDDGFVAFLDYRPLKLGHVLLIPRGHYETLDDVPDQVMGALAIRAKMISAAVMRAMAAEGSFIALNNVVSQSVPHVHVHIVPRSKGDGLFAAGYIWKRVSYRDDAERKDIAARIRAAFSEA